MNIKTKAFYLTLFAFIVLFIDIFGPRIQSDSYRVSPMVPNFLPFDIVGFALYLFLIFYFLISRNFEIHLEKFQGKYPSLNISEQNNLEKYNSAMLGIFISLLSVFFVWIGLYMYIDTTGDDGLVAGIIAMFVATSIAVTAGIFILLSFFFICKYFLQARNYFLLGVLLIFIFLISYHYIENYSPHYHDWLRGTFLDFFF